MALCPGCGVEHIVSICPKTKMGGRKTDKKTLIDLGYANGWGNDTPEMLKRCEMKGHLGFSRNVGNCLNKYGCEICGYSYLVDSSD